MKSLLRSTLSTALLFIFGFILVFISLFAEIFEGQTDDIDLAQIYANPIPTIELQHLKSLKISNKQGQFLMENTHMSGDLSGPWQLTEPQPLRVRSDIVEKIVDALNIIRVRSFHKLEPINITSFSLDNPTLTLLFTNDKDKSFEIKMGLINPIDNSSYLQLSTQNQIYQIDPIEISLESYDLSLIAESRVFALNEETLFSIEFLSERGSEFKVQKKDGTWVDQNNMGLNTIKIKKFLQRLEDIKSFSILSDLNETQKEFISKLLETPAYTLKIISGLGSKSYSITEVKNGIPGLPINKNNFFILAQSESTSFILLDRDQVRALMIKSNELK